MDFGQGIWVARAYRAISASSESRAVFPDPLGLLVDTRLLPRWPSKPTWPSTAVGSLPGLLQTWLC